MKYYKKLSKIVTISFLLIISFSFSLIGETRFDDIYITPQPVAGSEHTSHGYLEQIFVIRNNSSSHSHTVTLRSPYSSRHHYGNSITSNSKTFIIGPSSSINASLLFPPLFIANNDNIKVYIDGILQDEPLSLPSRIGHASSNARYNKQLSILLSRSINNYDLEQRLIKNTSKKFKKYHSSKSSDTLLITSNFDTHNWSRNWLSYTRFDGIVVKNEDIAKMPAPVRSAIFQYVEAGGSLVILGNFHVPVSWMANKIVEDDKLTLLFPGFGSCIITSVTSPDQISKEHLRKMKSEWYNTFIPWAEEKTIKNPNSNFPVIEKITIPVRGISLLMLVFALVIGPLNLFLLSRKNKRIWMLWTTPVFSFITCASVFIYSITSEGIKPYVRIEGLTLLDQSSGLASTLGLSAFYCPLTPGEGLHFSYNTEVTPIVKSNHDSRLSCTVEWTEDQHLESGWISARIPMHFMIRKSEKRRERIRIIKETNGKFSIINGLGRDISKLWICDANGNIYSASNVSAGEKVSPIKDNSSQAQNNNKMKFRNIFSSKNWINSFSNLSSNPTDFLLPNTYIAVTENSLFIENGLGETKKNKFRSTVYGIFDEKE